MQQNEIGHDIESLIGKAKEFIPETSLVHAKTFLAAHQFDLAFEEVVELLISSNLTIPNQLFESINNIGIYLGIKREVWSSLECTMNDS